MPTCCYRGIWGLHGTWNFSPLMRHVCCVELHLGNLSMFLEVTQRHTCWPRWNCFQQKYTYMKKCPNQHCLARHSYWTWREGISKHCVVESYSHAWILCFSTGAFNICCKLFVSLDILFEMRSHVQQGEPVHNCAHSLMEAATLTGESLPLTSEEQWYLERMLMVWWLFCIWSNDSSKIGRWGLRYLWNCSCFREQRWQCKELHPSKERAGMFCIPVFFFHCYLLIIFESTIRLPTQNHIQVKLMLMNSGSRWI